jgi:hypothetical protein
LKEQFPESPQPVKRMQFGGYELDKSKIIPEPRTFTKKFIFAHAAYLSADVFDIEMTHQGLAHHNCVEGGFDGGRKPSRTELYAVDMIVFAVTTGLDSLFQKDHPPKWASWIPYMGAVSGTVTHLKGGIEWYNRCW